jgi:hypothetical protein
LDYYNMKDFASEVSDILAACSDMVRAQTVDEFIKEGLAAR